MSDCCKDLESLRYHTFAHALYNFEKQTGDKREAIQEVWYDGGNGWVMCRVQTETDEYYISDEFVAALLLDWAKANNKLVEWKESKYARDRKET